MADDSDPEHTHEIVGRDTVPALALRPDDTQQDRIAKLLLWLQPTGYLSPGNEFMKHLASYTPGTGIWIQSSPIFRAWADLDPNPPDDSYTSCLHARGVAGSGKSVFAANTVRQLQDTGAVVLFFFFRQIVDKNHTAKYLVRDFAAQLLSHCPALVASLADFSQSSAINGSETATVWPAIVKSLEKLAISGRRVCCVVDALDEMDDADFNSTVERLVALSIIEPKNIRVLMTSRPLPKIEQALRRPCVAQLRLDPALLHPDVARYVDARMTTLEPPLSMEKSELVKVTICKRANGLFLHARLVTDNLSEGLREARITEATLPDSLDCLPRSLREVYEGMLKDHARRSGVTSEQQAKILMCVTHASRPLRLIELASLLCHMLGLDLRQGKDLVRAGCGRLLEILEDETVSVIHHSFTEFLHDATRNADEDAFPVLDAATSHAMMAVLSLEYLNGCPRFPPDLDLIKAAREHRVYGSSYDDPENQRRSAKRSEVRLAYPLAKYATENLGFHLKRADEVGRDPPAHVLAALHTFFIPERPALETWDLFLMAQALTLESINIVLVASQDWQCMLLPFFVLEYLAKTIPALVDERDATGRTPLSHAAEKGHAKLLSLLLAEGADPTTAGADGKTPLHWAAARGGPEVVHILLDAGVDPLIKTAAVFEERTKHGIARYTEDQAEARRVMALQTAFQDGSPAVVEAFRSFVTPEKITWCFHQVDDANNLRSIIAMGNPEINSFWRGTTKLYRAAEKHDLELIKILVKHGADPNLRSRLVSECGYDEDETESISAEIDESSRDRGPTPLHALAGQGNRGLEIIRAEDRETTLQCVRALVAAGADVDSTMDPIDEAHDDADLTPLHFAVQKRSDTLTYHGRCEQSEDVIVDALLSAGANPNAKTKMGNTPLHLASPDKVDLLSTLVEHGVDIYSRNAKGRTPLLQAINHLAHKSWVVPKVASVEVLMKLLDLGPDLSVTDDEGDAVMHHVMYSLGYFCTSGPKAIAFIQKLIDSGADLNLINLQGEAPIHRYRQYWDNHTHNKEEKEVLRLLVGAGMDLNAPNKEGLSILWQIVESDDHDIEPLKTLIHMGADPTVLKSDGTTLLHSAIASEMDSRWFRFLDEAGVRLDATGSNGDTLLHALCRLDGESYVQHIFPIFLKLGVPPLARNAKGQSVLHAASGGSCVENVLVSPYFNGLDVNEPDADGLTPLHLAKRGTSAVLLLHAGADSTALAANGLSPLHLAAKGGHADVLSILLAQYRSRGVLEKHVNLVGDGRTPLHYACSGPSHECVCELLRSGADPSLGDARGRSPLHALAEQDLTKTLKYKYEEIPRRTAETVLVLQLAGADLDAKAPIEIPESDKTAATTSALDLAVNLKHWEMVRALLSLGVTPREALRQSEDFIVATGKDRASMAAQAAQARVPRRSDRDRTYSWDGMVIWRGRWAGSTAITPEAGTRFVTSGQAILDTGDSVEIDALKGALGDGDYDSIDEFVQLGGRLNAFSHHNYDRFLHLVVDWGYLDLLKRYADQVVALETTPRLIEEELDRDGSLLRTVCERTFPSLHIIQLLVDLIGVDSEIIYYRHGYCYKRRGATALHALAQGAYLWQLEALEFLLSKGADIEARNREGMTPLQAAVSTKYGPGFFCCEDAARVLLEHGADPNAVVMVENEDGTTSRGLSTLELWGREEVTKMLVEHGARPEDIPAVVARAVQQTMKPETVKLVLEAGMDPNELPPDINEDGSSPRYALHEAARPSTLSCPGADYQSRQRAIVDLLLEHGADPWAPYPDGSSVVQCVVEDRGLVGGLMSRIKQDEVERRGRGGRTLLLSACIPNPPVSPPTETWRAHEPTPPVIMADAIHALLDMDADVLATDEEEGRTPLHWLCTYTGKFDEPSRKAFVAVAGRSAAALHMVDRLGRKPIHHALAVFTDCSQASAFAVRHLISMGADVGEPDPVTSDSTLHMLARRMVGEKTAAAEAATIFREVAATQDINARNAKGETAVFSFAAAGWKGTHATTWKYRHYALRNDVMHAAALGIFVELGADLKVVDKRGRTLMHATAGREVLDAAHWNQSEDIQDMFARLMELGVDPRAEDETLRTAIDVAVARERREVLALFTEEGRRKAEAERARREAREWDSDSDDFLGFTLTDQVE